MLQHSSWAAGRDEARCRHSGSGETHQMNMKVLKWTLRLVFLLILFLLLINYGLVLVCILTSYLCRSKLWLRHQHQCRIEEKISLVTCLQLVFHLLAVCKSLINWCDNFMGWLIKYEEPVLYYNHHREPSNKRSLRNHPRQELRCISSLSSWPWWPLSWSLWSSW